MNPKDDQKEQVLNRKCLKRNFEKLKSLYSVELLCDTPTVSSNKRSKELDLKEIETSEKKIPNEQDHFYYCQRSKRKFEVNSNEITEKKKKKKKHITEIQKNHYNLVNNNNDEITLNSLNECTSEELNQQKQNVSVLCKNVKDILSHNVIPNGDQFEHDNNNIPKGGFSQLAIIPFEREYMNNSSMDYKYERSSSNTHTNYSNNGNTPLDKNNMKNIFHFLARKDMLYQNLFKNQIKNNKPIMIKCDNLNLFLDKNKCEGELYTEHLPSDKTLHIDDLYLISDSFVASTNEHPDANRILNLQNIDHKGVHSKFFNSKNEEIVPPIRIISNEVPIFSNPDNAQDDFDSCSVNMIPNENINTNCIPNTDMYLFSNHSETSNTNDMTYSQFHETIKDPCYVYDENSYGNFNILNEADTNNLINTNVNENDSENTSLVNSHSNIL
ncbi:hypothetical protein, conserved [Plasmodium gonderi]|uniref:Uncharacterized protein n=1 Tax=Plasmodium gonderi TaxID=77519 RepID=A0A1Y1JHZ6_PLAGO|nr:hypothetical protein, conserved [Plasmodium gonderi]GAW82131.1 hypothetical protein, conserved [Plasmodium gonderi]